MYGKREKVTAEQIIDPIFSLSCISLSCAHQNLDVESVSMGSLYYYYYLIIGS